MGASPGSEWPAFHHCAGVPALLDGGSWRHLGSFTRPCRSCVCPSPEHVNLAWFSKRAGFIQHLNSSENRGSRVVTQSLCSPWCSPWCTLTSFYTSAALTSPHTASPSGCPSPWAGSCRLLVVTSVHLSRSCYALGIFLCLSFKGIHSCSRYPGSTSTGNWADRLLSVQGGRAVIQNLKTA